MKDPNLYQITYNTGETKIGRRSKLGPILAALRNDWGYKKPVKIERALEPEWEDVTTEFL